MNHHRREPDSRLRFRLFLGGELFDETWIDAANATEADRVVTATRSMHAEATVEAERAGMLWLIEVYDPSAHPAIAFLRFGTDLAGMGDSFGVVPMDPRMGFGGGVSVGGALLNGAGE